MIARLLGLSPLEMRHARLLAEAQLLMLWRGRSVTRGKKRIQHSLFATTLWTNLLMGAMIPIFTGMGLPERVRGAIWMAIGFFMAASIVAGDFAMSLLEHQDSDVLFHRPITSRALFAGRLMQVLGTVCLVTIGFFAPPAFAGCALSGGNPLFPVLYLFGGALQVTFVTLGILGLYAFLARFIHLERVKGIAIVLNAIIAVGIVLSYQMQTVWAQVGDRLEQVRAELWTYLLPPAWFSAPVEMLSWGPRRHLLIQSGIGVGITTMLWLACMRLLTTTYHERLARGLEHRRLGLHRPRTRWLVWISHLLLVRHGPERAGFMIVGRLGGIGRLIQSSLVFLALILLGVWQGVLQDPFHATWDEFGCIGAIYPAFLCFIPIAAAMNVHHHPQHNASWFMQVAPVHRYGDFTAGVKKGLIALQGPIYILLAAVLSCFWPPFHALLFVAFPLWVGLLFLHLYSILQHPLPLSQEPLVGTAGTQMFMHIMLAMSLGAGACIAHAAAYALGTTALLVIWAVLLLSVFLTATLSRWILNRRSLMAHAPE